MRIKNHLWDGFMVVAGVIVAVLAVSFWSGCSTASKKNRSSPTAPAAVNDVPAASAAAQMPAPAATAEAQVPAAATENPDQKAPLQKLRGVVQSYDAGTSTLMVKLSNGSTKGFKVGAAAKITKGGDFTAIAISDVKAGDSVRLGCRGTAVESLHVKIVAAQ